MILAGEPSGDIHGASLIKNILKLNPDARVTGIGGPNMAAAGVRLFYTIDRLSAMGATEVVLQFKYIKQAFDRFRDELRAHPPDLLILVDYPGFNLKAAAYAKKRYDFKILYYITPKVWAWNPGRLKTIKKHIDHAALIFPFEEKIYKKAHIPCTYVGNPLVDYLGFQIQPGVKKKTARHPLSIGLLPGSRRSEIDRLLVPMLQTALKIGRTFPDTRVYVSCAGSVSHDKISALVSEYDPGGLFELVQGHPGTIFNRADLLIAASGTVTLEAALAQVPTIIIYKMQAVSFFLAKILVKVKYAGLANIITNTQVMPELIQQEATPDNIYRTSIEMIKDLPLISRKLASVRKRLGPPGASLRAARLALNLIRKQR